MGFRYSVLPVYLDLAGSTDLHSELPQDGFPMKNASVTQSKLPFSLKTKSSATFEQSFITFACYHWMEWKEMGLKMTLSLCIDWYLVAKLCPTLSQPHGLQPSRLLCPRDFPSKNTGVGCHCFLWDIYICASSGSSPIRVHLQCRRNRFDTWVRKKIPWRRK